MTPDFGIALPMPAQRRFARWFGRRPCLIQMESPVISFTFDDFPRSALLTGGPILEQFGVTGTFYASMGLMGTIAPTGEIFHLEDLKRLTDGKHEIGCHTFDHCHAWNTRPKDFEASIVRNTQALRSVLPDAEIKTLSYPIANPRPDTKRRAAKYFQGCRSGGQTYNAQTCDLNGLDAFFLEQSRDNLGAIKKIIDANCRDRGWLIFATHDVGDNPTPYGCKPSFFEDVVRYSVDSAATLLPVSQALELINAGAE
jgi:peptidoglycan/xylan/chitin deacetylase (PgdA/CDA1 family)